MSSRIEKILWNLQKKSNRFSVTCNLDIIAKDSPFSQFTKDHYKLNFANIIITKKVVLNLNEGRLWSNCDVWLEGNFLKSCVKINES